MQLTRDEDTNAYQIRAYTPGKITVNEVTYTGSIIVSPSQIIDSWPPQTFQALKKADIDMIAALNPKIVILGTGNQQQFPNNELLISLIDKNIGIEIMNTNAACRTYAILVAEKRNVVAGLIKTL